MGYFLGQGLPNNPTVSLKDAIRHLHGAAPAEVPGTGTATLAAKGAGRLGKYVKPTPYEGGLTPEEAADQTPDVEQTIGDWQWPTELNDLYKMLWGKSEELLGKEPGFSQDAIDAMFGQNFENIRGAERGTREQTQNELAAQGMLGTGTALEALQKGAWETEKNVGRAKEDVFLANEAQKRADIESWTGLADKLFGSLSEYKTIQETMNAARRNEANNMLAMMLQYYGLGSGR